MRRSIEFIAAALMLLGIILAFFYLQIGGALVGFGFGLYFFEEIRNYFLKAKGAYSTEGLFRTLMLLGMLLYLLLAATAFVLATVVAVVIMTLAHLRKK